MSPLHRIPTPLDGVGHGLEGRGVVDRIGHRLQLRLLALWRVRVEWLGTGG